MRRAGSFRGWAPRRPRSRPNRRWRWQDPSRREPSRATACSGPRLRPTRGSGRSSRTSSSARARRPRRRLPPSMPTLRPSRHGPRRRVPRDPQPSGLRQRRPSPRWRPFAPRSRTTSPAPSSPLLTPTASPASTFTTRTSGSSPWASLRRTPRRWSRFRSPGSSPASPFRCWRGSTPHGPPRSRVSTGPRSSLCSAPARPHSPPETGRTSRSSLTPGDWSDLSEQLRPYESWIGTKPSSPVANLGAARINVILAGTGRKALEDLLSEDKVLAPKVAALADVERLALLSRDLGALLRNFVNFSDFYSRARPAVFQVGTLYLDSRSCRLCIRVDDIASHATFATMSRVFVTYLECRRPSGETMKIAAGFTQGDSDYLFVGRNGVFYDRRGRDWDATIVKIVASPISIRQSFWAPYKKVASFVGDQFSKFSASKDKIAATGLNKAVTAAATEAVQVVQPVPPPSPPSSFDIAKFAGIFAAVGLAVSAIGVALAAVFKGIENMPLWEKPLVVVVLLLLISGPSMLIAFLRLRQRTLGPLLEGTGWAVNGRVKINVPLGKALTDRGVLPPDSRRLAYDPYEDEAAKSRRYAVIGFAIAILVWLAAARVFRLWPF